jgi:two-component system LytT family sensor kinase
MSRWIRGACDRCRRGASSCLRRSSQLCRGDRADLRETLGGAYKQTESHSIKNQQGRKGRPWQNEAVMSHRMHQRIRLIGAVWLGWTIAGLFYIVQETVPRLYRGGAVPWKDVFVGWMTGMYVCAALTPTLLWFGNRWPIERRVTFAALHLCFSVLFSILATVIEVPILLLLGVFPAPTPPPSIAAGARIMLGFGIQGGVIRYWAVIALHAVYRSQKNAKAREREAFELRVQASELAQQLATAQLSSLKMQLQPHFLFNTLGAIMILIQQQKTAQAESMVEKLGDLLRLALDDVEAQEVPLWRELEFLRLYLSIEQVRFEDRLRVRIAPTTLSEVLVPHMVLQPIVENAVRHGLGESEEAVTIEVMATSSNGSLNLIVSDDGPGLLPLKPGRSGIGLTNTRNRLRRLYGDSAHLVIEQAADRGVRVTITLPIRTTPPEGS